MKRLWINLMAAALVLPLGATAAAAGKAKPPAQPLAGYTCEEMGVDQASHALAFTPTGFTFTLAGKSDAMCVDVPADLAAAAGVWTVTATANGTILRLLLVPRDSYSPGDSCGGVDLRSPAFPLVQPLPYQIPAATVNACGVQFGEWIDGVPVMAQTGAPHPLVFYALMSGRPRAQVTLTISLP
ncbi:MAG: hypothetical protein ABIJ48_08480 [Actinomycetota bacterium]